MGLIRWFEDRYITYDYKRGVAHGIIIGLVIGILIGTRF